MDVFKFNEEENELYKNLPLEKKFNLSLVFNNLHSASKEQLVNYIKNMIVMYEAKIQMLIDLQKGL